MEIEILKGEKTKEDGKSRIGYELKCLLEEAGRFCDDAYKLATMKELSDEDRERIIGLVASARGTKKVLGKMMGDYSDLTKAEQKKIEKEADAFADALLEKKGE